MTLRQKGPLAGIRVLEFGQIAAGPFAGLLFADLGADVVKVERPDVGDTMREWPPFFTNEEGEAYSSNFSSLNRNKRSIAVDFNATEQLDRLKRLCGEADVIVENYRPGVLKKFGLSYEALSAANPKLVYCSISGYGQEGTYAHKGAFDVTIQAISGLMSVTGEEGGDPVKCGVPVADFAAGLYGAYTVVAALLQTARDGKGAYIDCSMLGSALGISALQTSEYFGNGIAPRALAARIPAMRLTRAIRQATSHSSSPRATTSCGGKYVPQWSSRSWRTIGDSLLNSCGHGTRRGWRCCCGSRLPVVPPMHG